MSGYMLGMKFAGFLTLAVIPKQAPFRPPIPLTNAS